MGRRSPPSPALEPFACPPPQIRQRPEQRGIGARCRRRAAHDHIIGREEPPCRVPPKTLAHHPLQAVARHRPGCAALGDGQPEAGVPVFGRPCHHGEQTIAHPNPVRKYRSEFGRAPQPPLTGQTGRRHMRLRARAALDPWPGVPAGPAGRNGCAFAHGSRACACGAGCVAERCASWCRDSRFPPMTGTTAEKDTPGVCQPPGRGRERARKVLVRHQFVKRPTVGESRRRHLRRRRIVHDHGLVLRLRTVPRGDAAGGT